MTKRPFPLPLITVFLAGACTGEISKAGSGAAGDSPSSPAPKDEPPLTSPPVATQPPRVDSPLGASPPSVDRGACRLPPRRVVPLSPAQIAATAGRLVDGGISTTPGVANHLDVAAALESAAQSAGTRFSTDVDAHVLGNDDYGAKLLELGGNIGKIAFDQMGQTSVCLRSDPIAESCVSEWITRVGRNAFRRPLAADEKKELASLFAAERSRAGNREAVSAVVQAMFVSPSFLFRTEMGTGAGPDTAMTSHEIAQALSYWLLNGPPDPALDAAADADMLRLPAVREAQVKRLLAKPTRGSVASLIKKVPGLRQFFGEWLAVDPEPAKEARLYGGRAELQWGWMNDELNAFIGDHLWNRGGRWDAMLTDDAVYANQGLIFSARNRIGIVTLPKHPSGICDPAFPRRPASCSEDPANLNKHTHTRVEGNELDGARAGLLTSPLLMASHSLFDRTDAVLRGKWVRRTFLCQEMPAPPPDVAAIPPAASRTATARERFAAHSVHPSCAGCHRLMDPVGFGLETYDAVGKFRTRELSPEFEKQGLYFESGREIDPKGTLSAVTIDGVRGDYPFADARELASLLVKTDEAQRCFVGAAHAFAVNRYAHEADACVRDELHAAFKESGMDVVALFVRIAAREDFISRGAP